MIFESNCVLSSHVSPKLSSIQCSVVFDNFGFLICFDFCSVRLTWDVSVRDLNRQLGTPSHWLPVDSCKEGQKGALAAVCTPTLKSASKKHQKNYAPPYRSTAYGTLKVVKRKLCLVCISPSSKDLSLVPCA